VLRNRICPPPKATWRIVVVSSSIVWRDVPPDAAWAAVKSVDQLSPPKSCVPSCAGSAPSGRSDVRQRMMSGLVHGVVALGSRAFRNRTGGLSSNRYGSRPSCQRALRLSIALCHCQKTGSRIAAAGVIMTPSLGVPSSAFARCAISTCPLPWGWL
jgi:hypothetical protein